MVARSWTARRACGASMPVTVVRRSPTAIARQAGELDYAPAFQMGHPIVFELANRLVDVAPEGMDHVFFTNSGSESVDTRVEDRARLPAREGPGQPPPG